jgi:hypothetical protein
MLPPFPVVEPRLDPSSLPSEERRVLRRSAPERLRLDLPAPGWPPLLIEARAHPPVAQREDGGWARRLAGALRLLAPA